VRITNNCVVRGYAPGSRDWEIKPGTSGTQYQQYNVYGYHYIPTTPLGEPNTRSIVNISDTYVTPSYGGPAFGLIYVDGNVIIGSAQENAAALGTSQLNTIQGNVSIVATGNIWLASSLTVAGNHDGSGMPSDDNPNIVSMLSGTQGIIKVVDPGRTDSAYGGTTPTTTITSGPTTVAKYEPIGNGSGGSYLRKLSDPMVVEAGLIIGGGGWGAEYVGNRKETSGSQDDLIVRGTITERVRGVVGVVGTDGFLKKYYFDERLLEGFIPEDMRLKGKYIPVPASWKDYRP
jgi:hypothetical protein